MAFGLTSTPATFQRMMNDLLEEEARDKLCVIYLDDVLIHSETFEEHVKHVRRVRKKLRDAKLKLRLKKCKFGKISIEYLGHLISEGTIRPAPSKVKAIMNFP